MKNTINYLYLGVLIACTPINLKANNLADLPIEIWRKNLAPLMRARDLAQISQVSKKGQEIGRDDLIWKPIVHRYYPASITDNISDHYYSAMRRILNNRKEIIYNDRQHQHMFIHDLNFDGTVMSGMIKGQKFAHAQLKNGCFKILDTLEKYYTDEDKLYDKNQVSDDGLVRLIHDYSSNKRFIWTKQEDKLPFLADRRFSKKSALSKDGNRIVTQLWEDSTHAQILVHFRGLRRLIFLDDIFGQTYRVLENGITKNKKFIEAPINYNPGYGRTRSNDTGFVVEHICMNYLGNRIAMNVANRFYDNEYVRSKSNSCPKNESLSIVLSLPRWDLLEKEGIKFKNPKYGSLKEGQPLISR